MNCIRAFFHGLKTYSIGNRYLGLQLIVRNLDQFKEKFTRRYIRFIISLFGVQIIFEFRFSNSI
jgi:hypothetical protein